MVLAYRFQDLRAYLFDCPPAVNFGNQVPSSVVVKHGNGLLQIDLDTGPHRLRLVIFALDKAAPIRLARERPWRGRPPAISAGRPGRKTPPPRLPRRP